MCHASVTLIRRRTLLGLLLLLWSVPVRAEQSLLLPTADARRVAELVSWASLAVPIAYDVRESWQCEDRTACFVRQGVRLGAAGLVTYAVKQAFARQRPCAPSCGWEDPMRSFWSGHSMMACAAIGNGKHFAVTVPAALFTSGLRVLSVHWLTDAVSGCGAGLALRAVLPK